MNHVPVDGRNTLRSDTPSASKSETAAYGSRGRAFTGISPIAPNCAVVALAVMRLYMNQMPVVGRHTHSSG